MRINFDFGDLEAFLAVAELGSFQRASALLNISQSAITRRIQKLESSLGVRLFARTTRSMKLTLAAKGFRNRAQVILDDATEALRALGDDSASFQYQRNAIINIAIIPTATHMILPLVIKKFHEDGNRARINILDLLANEVSEAVAQGEADFGIGFMGIQEHGLEFARLIEDQFVLAMSPDNPLSRKRRIHWSDIAKHLVVVPWKGTGNRMLIDDAMARSRQNLNWTYQAHHSSTSLGIAESGAGVAVLPESAIPSGKRSSVVSRPLVDPVVTRVIGTVRRTGQTMPPLAERFYQLLIENCANLALQKDKVADRANPKRPGVPL